MNSLEKTSAGFIGAILAGFMSGIYVNLMKKWFEKMPHMLQGVKDMIIVPLLSVIMVGATMFIGNIPFSMLNIGIAEGINALAVNAKFVIVLIGALVSALMAIDMGGPINKATHYAVLNVLSIHMDDPLYQGLMAANIVGIMVPPVMIALAT